MTGRRAVIGLSLLSTLVFCAFAAPNATAVLGTTAFKCVKTDAIGEEFSDEHCTSPQQGKAGFTQMQITPNTEAKITVNNSVTGSEVFSSKLRGVVSAIEFELEAGSFHSCVGKTTVENRYNGVKQGEAWGKFCGEFSTVKVNKPAKCEIEKGIVKLLESGTGKTIVKEVEKKQEMYIEFTPPEGKPFSEFTFAGGECALKGAKVSVTGSAKANVTTNESQTDGATLNFTTAQTGKTLKVGINKAEFEGVFTPREVSAEAPPVVLTTANF
jgi:hypothetical protein